MLVPLDEEVRLLHTSDILEPLSERELEELAQHNPDVSLQEGEILFGPEEVGERLYIVKDGQIRLYKVGPEGTEMTLAMLNQGRIFGEMALTAQQIRQAYAQATKPSLLISLGQEAIKRLICDKPAVGIRLVERLSERVRTLEERLKDVTFKEMPARLASLLLGLVESEGVKTEEGYYKIPTRYSHDQLATMVNAHRVSVSRAFRKLRESGAVEIKDHLVHIKDIEALGSIAGEEHKAKRIAEDPA